MPDTSEHRNKLCSLIFFYKTKSLSLISCIPANAAAAVLLNPNKQCLKYRAFCTLSTIFSFSLPGTDQVFSLVAPREIFVSKLHSCEAFQANHCLRIKSWQYQYYTACQMSLQIRCLTNHPEPSLISLVLCNHQKVFLQLWAWQTRGCQKATLACKSRRTNRLSVLQTICIASTSVQAEDLTGKRGLLVFKILHFFGHLSSTTSSQFDCFIPLSSSLETSDFL